MNLVLYGWFSPTHFKEGRFDKYGRIILPRIPTIYWRTVYGDNVIVTDVLPDGEKPDVVDAICVGKVVEFIQAI